MSQSVAYYPLFGGEDLVTPPLAIPPGRVLYSKNYEPGEAGGYRRIDGYERFDGQPKPSEATFVTVTFDAGTNEPNVNDAISFGAGGTGNVVGYTVTSGDWSTNDAVGTLALDNIAGDTIDDDDVITNTTQVNTLATASAAQAGQSAPTQALYDTWLQATIEFRRSQITGVTGSGNIRGVFTLGGTKYAIRDNAGGTAGTLWQATSSGWSQISTLGYSITLTAGSGSAPQIGQTITGGTSGATGVVTSYEATGGTEWGTLTSATIYFHTLTGNFQAENVTWTGGSGTCSGAESALTLPAGGKYEYVVHNFYGQNTTTSIYAANGVGKALVFDGTGVGFIDLSAGSGIFPKHVRAHASHLFLDYGASIINSETGDPSGSYSGGGTVEYALGDTVTGMEIAQGDALAMFTRNSTRILFGNTSSDFVLKDHSATSGAREYTIQNIMNARYLDDRGFTQLNAVFAFGDFKQNTFSKLIDPLVRLKLGNETTSVIVREKDQYRCFFDDGSGLICRVTDTNELPQFTRMVYPNAVHVATSGEDSTGKEEIFFGVDDESGDDDGFVYQMDVGTSFDGAAVEYILRLPFNNLKSPRSKKRYFKAIFEIEAPTGGTINFAPEFSYGSSETPKGRQEAIEVESNSPYWGEDIIWGSFIWGAESPALAEAYVEGSGTNMGLLIRGSSIYDDPHTITSVMIHYKVRGLKR